MAELIPHAGSASNNIDSSNMRVERVGQTPVFIFEVIIALQASKADIEIGQVIIGKNDLIGAAS